MISEKLQNAINEQITAEMWSANLYLAMSFFMEKEGYNGMANWLKKQSFEEHEHAFEMASYIIKRGGSAKVDKIDVVPNDFGTPLEVFEQVYKHECRVSKMIDDLVDVAADPVWWTLFMRSWLDLCHGGTEEPPRPVEGALPVPLCTPGAAQSEIGTAGELHGGLPQGP